MFGVGLQTYRGKSSPKFPVRGFRDCADFRDRSSTFHTSASLGMANLGRASLGSSSLWVPSISRAQGMERARWKRKDTPHAAF